VKTKFPAEIILHITTSEEWQQAMELGTYQAASLSSEGFIHCSRPDQVMQVANTFFLGQTDLVVLCIDRTQVAAPIRDENLEGGENRYPHIYGPLNLDAIRQVVQFPPDLDGRFKLPAELDG
jgi:uncharacterized protein (DUF952 family)